MKTVTIQITPEILKNASSSCTNCPIALALRSQGYENISVFPDHNRHLEYICVSTQEQHDFVWQWDNAGMDRYLDPKFLQTFDVIIPV